MALNRKYAALPDLDNAPDIYETPELTDDNSTVLTAAARTHSDDEFYEIDDESRGISRAGLRIDEARSRFADANETDFSDRVDGKRRSYRASNRRQRALQGGPEELGDISEDEAEESLERRIARLKREVEEAKEEHGKRRTAPSEAVDAAATSEHRLESLSQALDDLSRPAGVRTPHPRPPSPEPTAGKASDVLSPSPSDHGPTYTITYAPTYEQTHALAKAADFDRRLLALERALGISASSVPEAGEGGLPRALLPTLDSLDKQISTLSQASTANLDSISRRVRALAADQDKLNDAREKAKALREELGGGGGGSSSKNPAGPPAATDSSEHEAKINALYAILPTIEGLTPLLPPLMDRLRSLRAIHADAATAAQTLDRIEKQQAEAAAELRMWREGLDKLEGSIGRGDESMKSNMAVMQGWVRDLEQRLDKIS